MSQGRAWLLCTLLFFATALSFLDRQVLSVLAPQITAEFGMSNAVYSRVVFMFVLSYTVMFSLGGRLMDAMGTRLGRALSVGLWSVASAAHGKGRVVWGKPLRAVLGEMRIGPDFTAPAELDFIHRRDGGTDIYFVRNTTNKPVAAAPVFRATGRQPGLWDAVTGGLNSRDGPRWILTERNFTGSERRANRGCGTGRSGRSRTIRRHGS